jgi:hypothetical protein
LVSCISANRPVVIRCRGSCSVAWSRCCAWSDQCKRVLGGWLAGSALQWLDVKKLAEYHVSLQRQILLLSLKRGGAAGRGWGGCFFSVFCFFLFIILFLFFYNSFPFFSFLFIYKRFSVFLFSLLVCLCFFFLLFFLFSILFPFFVFFFIYKRFSVFVFSFFLFFFFF